MKNYAFLKLNVSQVQFLNVIPPVYINECEASGVVEVCETNNLNLEAWGGEK